MLALACFRRAPRNIGYDLSLMENRWAFRMQRWSKPGGRSKPRHLMIAHILSVGKKMALMDTLHLKNEIDTYFVYSNRQKEFIQERWAVEPERVVFTPFMVDDRFFEPSQANPPHCCSRTWTA
jgi:hypothetical protein